jgi:hypothetical protein
LFACSFIVFGQKVGEKKKEKRKKASDKISRVNRLVTFISNYLAILLPIFELQRASHHINILLSLMRRGDGMIRRKSTANVAFELFVRS